MENTPKKLKRFLKLLDLDYQNGGLKQSFALELPTGRMNTSSAS